MATGIGDEEHMFRFSGILELVLVAAAGNPPTQNGDQVGWVSMLPDRTLVVDLRSVDCGGTIAEAQLKYRPDQTGYASMVERYKVRAPGETDTITAKNLSPCPK